MNVPTCERASVPTYRLLGGFLLGLGLLALLARNLKWEELLRAFQEADPRWAALAFLANTGTLWTRTFRWQALLRPRSAPFLRTWRALLVGQLANAVLPGRAGDLVRAAWLTGEGHALARVLASVVAEKVWDLLALSFCAALLLALAPLPAWFTRPVGWLALILALGLPVSLAFLAHRERWLGPLERMQWRGIRWLAAFLREATEGFRGLHDTGTAARVAGWTGLTWALGALANWGALRAFGVGNWPAALFLLAVLMAGQAIRVSPGQLGVWEALAVLALGIFGVDMRTGLAVGLALHGTVLLPLTLGALVGLALLKAPREPLGENNPAEPKEAETCESPGDGRDLLASVIVPAYNAADTIGVCVRALARQTVPCDRFEVIVVDDGSTDDTAAVAAAAGARVLRIPHSGPAAARNAGARIARAPILLFTDADCEPGPTWVESMLQAFSDPRVAGAKGTYRTRQRGLVPRFVQAEYEEKYARLERQETIDFVDTYAAGYRREVFLTNRGFDPGFPVPSVEDQEFSFRLSRKGYRLVFVPEAWVWHRHDRNLWEYLRRKFGIGYWKALLLRRHPERVVYDSHTPALLRWQIALLALTIGGAAIFPFLPALWPVPVITAAAFLGTTLPLITRIWRDPLLVLATPFLLACRALALGTGLFVGFLRFAGRPLPVHPATRFWPRVLKRALDLVGAAIGLLLFGPLILLLAVLIRLDSPGPAFFVQERVGQYGRRFRMIKLRTMRAGAEEETDPAAAIPKPEDDPRVTRLGRFLRRWSLDELPQLVNVLKGEMSLVGPRPEQPGVVERYADWHRRRLLVRPGMTGPMQVNGRGDLGLEQRMALEVAYVDNYSLWQDLVLLARTLPAVISGKGAR